MTKRLTTVFIAGGFDCMHMGHLHLLTEARKLGDRLVIALNYDPYFARKGPGRPVDTWEVRARNVRATGLVDDIYFIKDEPLGVIMHLKPDVIACGDDYAPSQVVGYPQCLKWGGKVVLIPRIPGISTTEALRQRTLS